MNECLELDDFKIQFEAAFFGVAQGFIPTGRTMGMSQLVSVPTNDVDHIFSLIYFDQLFCDKDVPGFLTVIE